jgi:hypothetical protein
MTTSDSNPPSPRDGRAVDTGGAYVEGNRVEQGNIIAGGSFSGPVIGGVSGGTVSFGAAGAGAALSVTDARACVQQASEQARQQGQNNLADDLEDIAATVK